LTARIREIYEQRVDFSRACGYNFVHMEGKPGRPRSRPTDLVVFNAQMTADAKDRLKAIAHLEGTHAYALLEEAFWEWWQALPESRRDRAELIAKAVAEARRTQDDPP